MSRGGGGGTAEGTNSMCQDWSEEEGAAVEHSQLTPEGACNCVENVSKKQLLTSEFNF